MIDNGNDNDGKNYSNLLCGYLGCITSYCEVKISEPFELANFPYDCQDIPIVIQPKNFKRLAPAWCGKENKTFIKVTGDATHLGRWSMKNTITEFNNKSNQLRIMLKLERSWLPYLLDYCLFVGAVCGISLTAFSIDREETHERLAIVLGLILTLIFIDLPTVPMVTLLDKYYYTNFVFLFLLSINFATESYYAPILLKIENRNCYEYVNDNLNPDYTEDDCSWYNIDNYNLLAFIIFTLMYLIYHFAFLVGSISAKTDENQKIIMNSDQIKEKVEDEARILTTQSVKMIEDELYSKKHKTQFTRWMETDNSHVDTFAGHLIRVESEENDDDNVISKWMDDKHREFNKTSDKLSEVCERYVVTVMIVTVAFVILPLLCSILQFVFLRLDICQYRIIITKFVDVEQFSDIPQPTGYNYYIEPTFFQENLDANEDEQIALIVLSVIQSILSIVSIVFWFGCCTGGCVRKIFVYTLPIAVIVIISNYVLAIKQFIYYFNDSVSCGTTKKGQNWKEALLYYLFLIWIVIYALIFVLSYAKLSFPNGWTISGPEEFNAINDSKINSIKVVSTKLKDKNLMRIKNQYFVLQMFNSIIPIVIQVPASIMLILLIGDSNECTDTDNNDNIINVYGVIILFVLSIIFHFIRALLYSQNSFFYYFTYYQIGYQSVNLLALHAFVFIHQYDSKCPHNTLYNILWYWMLFWILYDNLSIFGVLSELIMEYYKNRRKLSIMPFVSILIVVSVMLLQLSSSIGGLYVILNENYPSPIALSSSDIIAFIIIIWIQILIYKLMQINRTLSELNVVIQIPILFLIFILSMQSFSYWAAIDINNITVSSVLFSIILFCSILFDFGILLVPTMALPMAAFYFYTNYHEALSNVWNSKMFRAMFAQFLFFLFPEMITCMTQLITVWNGTVNTISNAEAIILFFLTWISLLISFMYTYIYFDNDLSIRKEFYGSYDLKRYLDVVKYILYGITIIIWCIMVHCFSFWSRDSPFGWRWCFFLIWMIIYVITSIIPLFRYTIMLLCGQNKLERWVNIIYIIGTLFMYAFVQLPSSIMQFYMIEFNRCSQSGLPINKAESYCLLIFTLLQLILFYAICDLVGWNDEADEYEERKEKLIKARNQKHHKSSTTTIIKKKSTREHDLTSVYAAFNNNNNNDTEYDDIIKKQNKKKLIKNLKKTFRKRYGFIFYIIFAIIYAIQFGFAVHSFTYWSKKLDCDTQTDQNIKLYLFISFVVWVGTYSFMPFGSVCACVLKLGISKYREKSDTNNNNNNNKKDNNDNK